MLLIFYCAKITADISAASDLSQMCCRIINDITKQIKPSHVVFQVLHLNYCHLCNNMQITQHWCHIWMLLHAASFHCSSSTVVWMLLHAASSHCGSSQLLSLSATSYSAEDLPNQRQVLHQHQLVWGKRRKQLQGEWCWNSTSVDFPVLLLVSGMIERVHDDRHVLLMINHRDYYCYYYYYYCQGLF